MMRGKNRHAAVLGAGFAAALLCAVLQVAVATPVQGTPSFNGGLALAMADEAADAVDAPEQKTSIANARVSVSNAVYTGAAQTPAVSVTLGGTSLAKDTDYTVSYAGNTNAGTGRATVTGIGSYEGTNVATFTIARAKMSSVKASVKDQTYSGKALKPAVKATLGGLSLAKGKDFTVRYKANKKAGTATVKLTGTGNMTGSKTVHFKIKRRSIAKAKVSGISTYKYTGSRVKPTPTVKLGGKKLVKGRDYSLSYSNNVKAGKAKVVIKGKGNYKGSKSKSFRIKKPASKKAKASSSSHGGTVYWTPSGSVYHVSSSCPTLSRSRTIYSGSVGASGKSRACKICS